MSLSTPRAGPCACRWGCPRGLRAEQRHCVPWVPCAVPVSTPLAGTGVFGLSTGAPLPPEDRCRVLAAQPLEGRSGNSGSSRSPAWGHQ